MKITCFITVCVYLSSTVSTNEIKSLNRIIKTKLREDLALKDFTVKKEVNSIPAIYPDVYSTLQKSRGKVWVETFQKPKMTRGPPLGPQQQHRHYNHGRSKRLIKRLKTRSITSVPYELDDNQLNELTKSISEAHGERPIHIEPVLRVHKKNVFDSIVDIVSQLLNPQKNEPGPLLGPINVPGSARKIYLRLLEPVDSSHVNVRFVSQVKVPVIDAEPKHGPVIPIPPIIDPSAVFLKNQHTTISDAVFASTRHLSRNVSHPSGKVQAPQLGKSSILNPNSPLKNVPDVGTSIKEDFLPGNEKENKNPLAELNLENHENPFFGGASSYYPYQAGEDAVNQVKQLLNDSTPAIENGDLKNPPGTWYELSTHRLPLRQIASLYPLASVESSSPSSYEDTYKAPSDVLTGPSFYTSPYAQFNNAEPAPGPYTNDPHYGAPSSHSVSYNKPNDVHTTPSSYSISYQKQNEFINVPSSYIPTTWNQEEFNNNPSTYSKTHEKPNDLYDASSSYSISYAKPDSPPLSSSSSVFPYQKQNDSQITSNSNDALRVIDPPPFFPAYQKPSESNANRSSSIKHSTIRQLRTHNLQNLNEVSSSSGRDDQQVIWGETKREKNESSPRQSGGLSEANDARDRWQPVIYLRENTDWHKAYADLTKIANDHRETKQPFEHLKENSRNVTLSSLERASALDRYTASRRHGTPAPVSRASKCSVFSKEVGCEQAKPTLTPDLETSTKVVGKQTQPTIKTEPIVVVSEVGRNDTVGNMRLLDVTTKSPITSSTTSSTIERSLLLILTTKSPAMNNTTLTPLTLPLMRTSKSPVVNSTERFLVEVKTSGPTADKAHVKLATKPTMKSTIKPASSTTEKPSTIKSHFTTKEAFASSDIAKLLPRRPMIMKKPTFIMKTVTSSTTQRPTVRNAMKKMMTMRKSTFRNRTSPTKSSTI